MVRITMSCCGKVYVQTGRAKAHRDNRARLCKVCVHCNHDFGSGQKQRHHITQERCPVLHKEQVEKRKAEKAAARARKKTAHSFHNTVNSTVSSLTTKVQNMRAMCEKQGKQLLFLKEKCDGYDALFQRIRGDMKAHGVDIEYVGHRQTAIERHFERTPVKLQMLLDKIQDLEVTLDRRKKREKTEFPDYDRPIRIDHGPGKNGPDFCYRGTSLGDVEKALRVDLKSVKDALTLDGNEKRYFRTQIRRRVQLLNKQEYTWPAGRPIIPDAKMAPATAPPEWRARGKGVKERDARMQSPVTPPPSIRSGAPSPEDPAEESKQHILFTTGDGDKVPYDSHKCPFQEPLPGKVYRMEHYVRQNGNARPLSMSAKIWRNSVQMYRRQMGFSLKWDDLPWYVNRIKEAAHILKKWPCEVTGDVLSVEEEFAELR
jgi:hypothetical protein